MREIQDPHGRDAADARADAHGENSGDAATPRPLVLQDATARIVHAFEYRQRVSDTNSTFTFRIDA